MNHIAGSAVEIFCEVPSDKITGTALTLHSLTNPSGTELATGQSLTFSVVAGETNVASYVWQSVAATHPVGRYKFTIKSVNGAVTNYAKGSFYLTE
jgi:hypothetical protein